MGVLRKNAINSFSWSGLFLFWVFGWGRWGKSLGFWCGYGLCYVGFVWEGLWERRTAWKWLHQALWVVSMNVHCACVSALIFLFFFFFFPSSLWFWRAWQGCDCTMIYMSFMAVVIVCRMEYYFIIMFILFY